MKYRRSDRLRQRRSGPDDDRSIGPGIARQRDDTIDEYPTERSCKTPLVGLGQRICDAER